MVTLASYNRGHFEDVLGRRWGRLVFHRLAAPATDHSRMLLLTASIQEGPLEVLRRLDKERVYLPTGEVIWDSQEHLN